MVFLLQDINVHFVNHHSHHHPAHYPIIINVVIIVTIIPLHTLKNGSTL